MRCESLGALVGSLIGTVGTEIAIYFTGSIWSAVIGFAGFLFGMKIGSIFDKQK